jgi:hypothetical protein
VLGVVTTMTEVIVACSSAPQTVAVVLGGLRGPVQGGHGPVRGPERDVQGHDHEVVQDEVQGSRRGLHPAHLSPLRKG